MKPSVFIPLILILAATLPAAAQDLPEMVPVKPDRAEEKAPTPSQTAMSDPLFVESIEVRVIEIEVFVTDRDGNPVTGLTRDDFELIHDGQETAISNFYAVEGGEVKLGIEAPDEEAVAAPPPLPKKQPLNLVIYIDNFNIHQFNRKKVLKALKTFLRGDLAPDDRVMMVTYDRSLIINNTFTTDHARIISTINEIDEKGGDRVFYEQDRRDLLNEIAESANAAQMIPRVENFAESVYNELRFSLDALNELVGFLAGIEGRKALIYVSDGLPMTAAEELFYAIEEKSEQSGAMLRSMSFKADRRFEEVIMAANANQVTLYTIDAAGHRDISGADAQDRARNFSGHIDTVTALNMQSSLKLISGETGGQAVTNTNNILGGLQRMAQDFTSYYSIGFKPGHAGDGQFHRTRVKVKRDGLTVRQRRGYRDQPASKKMEEGTVSSLVLGYQDNPLGFDMRTGAHQPYEDGTYIVPIEVRIPIGKLTLLNRAGAHQGRVLITVAARKDNGDISPVQEHVLPISIPEADWETAQKQVYTYEMSLVMAPGFQRMAVGVKDELAAEISYVARTIRVGKDGE